MTSLCHLRDKKMHKNGLNINNFVICHMSYLAAGARVNCAVIGEPIHGQ